MQLSTLQDVYTHEGPYVTVHLDVSRNNENAEQQIDARWRTARQQLEGAGISQQLIDSIGERVLEPTELPGEVRRTVIGAGEEIVFDDVVAGRSNWPDVVSCGDLPDLSPWLHQADGQIPFLLVVADRVGADIDYFRADLRPGDHSEVDGSKLHLHHFKGGGWAHQRFQERTENQAASNARDVAQKITGLVARHRPRVVILAGVQSARSEIVAALDGLPSELVEIEAGGRAEGSSDEALWEEVRRVIAHVEAEDQQRLTDRLSEKWGQGSGAVLGVDDVLSAMIQGQVETLILDLQKAQEMSVDPSRFPGLAIPQQAATKKELPAGQVLVAAAAATDARIAVLPAGQTKGGGVAALLRWDNDRTSDTV